MILSVAEIPKIQVSGRYVWSESGADLKRDSLPPSNRATERAERAF